MSHNQKSVQNNTNIERRTTRPRTQNQTAEIKNRAKIAPKTAVTPPVAEKQEEDQQTQDLKPANGLHIANNPPVDLEQLEHQFDSSEDKAFAENGDADEPLDLYSLQQQQSLMARKREIKGSYKAKLPLDKLIVEHERKRLHLRILREKRDSMIQELEDIGSDFVQRHHGASEGKLAQKIDEPYSVSGPGGNQRTHSDFLFKEMHWMQEDFEREHKKKAYDAKKNARTCRKELAERKVKKEKQLKDQQVELRRKANTVSKMVGVFWKSVEKIVRHNYTVQIEQKRQQQRAKKLESFVSKHLKLSVRVAEELNTKSFVEQSMYKDEHGNQIEHQESLREQVKIYDSQTGFEEAKDKKKEDDKKMTTLADMTVKMAEAFQPVGIDLSSTNVVTKVPFLLHGSLREYQIIGLDWLVTLHNKRLNGILADEMGLGKTIQTISLLASLATDKGIWGPHLIVVPTTIMINWEMEFKRWCPSLKVLTYFGSQKERKQKRQGWSKENSFHVCITSYKLVIQDHFVFRRKKWYYMVLDEAQNIKNFKSQRWQTLLRFNTRRRLLLTGTPLQNDVMELWSLMHFLMPQIFSSQQDFKEWFSNPFSQSINQNQSLNIGVVQKLQSILRPFLLRRMKRDVEKQLPEKIEHIVQCNLSRRQRLLYDEYINNDKTQSTLVQSDFFSIMNVLMQLRKVCNHPDLFESRTIDSPFIMTHRQEFRCPSLIFKNQLGRVDPLDMRVEDLCHFPSLETQLSRLQSDTILQLYPAKTLQEAIKDPKYLNECNTQNLEHTVPQILPHNPPIAYHKHPQFVSAATLPYVQDYFKLQDEVCEEEYHSFVNPKAKKMQQAKRMVALFHADLQNRRKILMKSSPIYGTDLRKAVQVIMPMNFDSTSRQPMFTYVNRHTKTKEQPEIRPPSTVFNPFCGQDQCPVLVTDITHSDYSVQKGSMIQELKPKEVELSNEKLPQQRFREVTREIVVEGPPGIHGVIIEVDLKKSREPLVETPECLRFYSLKLETEQVIEPITPSEQSQEDEEMVDVQSQNEEVELKRDVDIEMAKSHNETESEQEDQDEADEKRRADEQALQKQQVCRVEQTHNILPRFTDSLREMITSPLARITAMEDSIKYFKCIIPKVVVRSPLLTPSKVDTTHSKTVAYERFAYQKLMSHRTVTSTLKWSNILFFPHKNLVQYDCGKLQRLAQLLKTLYLKGSKVLIFTQMTRMLDILEQFLNLHGYSYVRLDGSVKVEARQKMVDRFNLSPKLFCFISSTRCGGIGINLTGADCVIFYDTDWNPAMDKQAQDRSHRIGQTKTVHIYRLISVNTVEENIFKKSLQKRELGSLIIASESFDSTFFGKVNMKDLLQNKVDALIPKINKKNLMQEENIVFHDQKYTGGGKDNKEEDDLQAQHELEAYRRKFEEAMIRIEDQEDIEAYKEAKAELDDEFRELEEDKQLLEGRNEQTEKTTDLKQDADDQDNHQQNDPIVEEKQEKKAHQQQTHELDKKNAAGLSRDLRRNEMIDWQNNEQLNTATKSSIRAFEREFTFDDFMREREEKEGKKKDEGQQSDASMDDQEEEADAGVQDWDRQWAERIFQETQQELMKQIEFQ